MPKTKMGTIQRPYLAVAQLIESRIGSIKAEQKAKGIKRDARLKYENIAEALDMTTGTLRDRIEDPSTFKLSEIDALSRILSLPIETLCAVIPGYGRPMR